MKNLTKTKKLVIGIIALVVALTALGAGSYSYAKSNAQKNAIGIDKAINIAMTDAGADEADTVVTKAKLELNSGVFAYDIEFNVATINEYEYSIKADDGTILERSRDIDDDADETEIIVETTAAEETTAQAESTDDTQSEDSVNDQTEATTSSAAAQEQTTQSSNTTTKKATTTKAQTEATTKKTTTKKTTTKKATTTASSSTITASKAKTIALNAAGVSKNNAKNLTAHKDYDDGIAYYDVEFNTSDYEYEYEIDMSGNIISYDKEPYKTKKKTTTTTTTTASTDYIGVDAAKKKALKDAGLSSSQVTFIKAKFEIDDGIPLYEIEFETTEKEYEYEIQAVTGSILDKSIERLDYDD
ncbi:MAG: PepSY domain-containing protein [Clostridiales bacterium]|nr:PepSY domain-containing protein [Clostridiales bacterium]